MTADVLYHDFSAARASRKPARATSINRRDYTPMANRRNQSTATKTVVELRPNAATDPAAYAARVKKQNRDRQAAKRARKGKTAHVMPPTLSLSVAGSIVGGGASYGLWILLLAQYANMRGVLTYLRPGALDVWPGSLGAAGALGLVTVEAIGGLLYGAAIGIERTIETMNRMEADTRRRYSRLLAGLLVGAALVDGGLSWVAVDMGQDARVATAAREAPKVKAVSTAIQTDYIGPKALESQGAADVERMKAEAKLNKESADQAAAQATKTSEDRRTKDTVVQVGLSLVLAIGAGLCSIVAGAFVHSFLAIPGAFGRAVVATFRAVADAFRRDPAPQASKPKGDAPKQEPKPAPTVPPRRRSKGNR